MHLKIWQTVDYCCQCRLFGEIYRHHFNSMLLKSFSVWESKLGLAVVNKLGEVINRSQGRQKKIVIVNSRRMDKKLILEELKLICRRKRDMHSSGGRHWRQCSTERSHKYSMRDSSVTHQENKALSSCYTKIITPKQIWWCSLEPGEIWLEGMSKTNQILSCFSTWELLYLTYSQIFQ